MGGEEGAEVEEEEEEEEMAGAAGGEVQGGVTLVLVDEEGEEGLEVAVGVGLHRDRCAYII